MTSPQTEPPIRVRQRNGTESAADHQDAMRPRMHQPLPDASNPDMRTTLTLDDEAAELARNYARARDLKLGQAVSELIRRAGAQPLPIRRRGQTWVFELPADAPRVTARQVKDLLDDSP